MLTKPEPETEVGTFEKLKDRLLWNTTEEQLGTGPYRETVLVTKTPSALSQLIRRNRRKVAAVAVAAGLFGAYKGGNAIVESMNKPEIGGIDHPEDEILVPYANIGGVNTRVSSEMCKTTPSLNCQINLGNGPRPFNGPNISVKTKQQSPSSNK